MRTLIVAAMLLGVSSGIALAQDAAKGANVFKKCMPCHNIGPGATNKIGPELNGLDGRHSGSVPDYAYSEANKKSGIVWNKEMFEKYINDPRGVVPGTKMTFAGDQNKHEVDDLWAYVSQFDASGNEKK